MELLRFVAASSGVSALQSWSEVRAELGHRRLSGEAAIKVASGALWEPLSRPFQAYLLYSKINQNSYYRTKTEEKLGSLI